MKRYFMEYDSDKKVCGSYSHIFGFTNSIETAKGYIRRCRKGYAGSNPRNFRIYDTWADVPEGEHVPCVYQED